MGCSTQSIKNLPAQQLIDRLTALKGKGILFGHQDNLAYGRHWRLIDGESDVKRVTGGYPAVFGWELGGLEQGNPVNIDSVPFESIRRLVVKAHQMGGINTFSWHPFSATTGQNSWFTDSLVVKNIIPGGTHHEAFKKQLDHLAEFFASVKDSQNQPIPVIFRPWHEMNGTWFWWGKKFCTPDEYKALFRFTVSYLTETKGLKNLVIAYSPNVGYQNTADYLMFYPGDDLVDLLGLDQYEWPDTKDFTASLQKSLSIMIDVANQKHKLAALTETGAENVPDSVWFTQKLGKAIEADSISKSLSYLLIWRNDPKVHHFFAFENHPSADDARVFLDKPEMLLLDDLKKLERAPSNSPQGGTQDVHNENE